MNPAKRLHDAKARGMRLVVIDPRRTESAALADVWLQARPGEDAAVLAAIAHVLIAEGMIDRAFPDAEADGFAGLRDAVAPFTPAMAGARAGLDPEAIVQAARAFGRAGKGAVSAGTGANMSGRANLVEYLVKSLTTLKGFWRRAGEPIANPGVLIKRPPFIAGSPGPMPAWGLGEASRVRGLTQTAMGMPTAALSDEILLEGPGRVRALFVFGGNPIAAWPDQIKTAAAMEALDLLVTFDPHLSATARKAHYVLAPTLPFEVASATALNESFGAFGPGWGYELPYAQACGPLTAPPPGADVIEEWAALFGIARRMGLSLKVKSMALMLDPEEAARQATVVAPGDAPSSDDVWAMTLKGSPVPLEVVRRKPEGGVFDVAPAFALPKPEGWTGKLRLDDPIMLAELSAIAAMPAPVEPYAFRLISRRLRDVLNSCWHEHDKLLRAHPYNAAFMNPDDMAAEGLKAGDLIEIRSARAAILGVAAPEEGVRRGCISMSHAWGGALLRPGEAGEHARKRALGRARGIGEALRPDRRGGGRASRHRHPVHRQGRAHVRDHRPPRQHRQRLLRAEPAALAAGQDHAHAAHGRAYHGSPPMMSVAEARAAMLAAVTPLKPLRAPLLEAAGLVLAEAVIARRSQPPFPASAMDGYAVRAADGEGLYRVLGEAAAGRAYPGRMGPMDAVRIATGAPMPEGADAVVVQEEAFAEGDRMRLPQTIAGRHVRPRGGDFAAGAELAPAGRRLTGAMLALAAAAGAPDVLVRPAPRVQVLAGGDELAAPGTSPRPDQIFESGSYGVMGLIAGWGAAPAKGPTLKDDLAAVSAALGEGLAAADLVVMIGGASVGAHDHARAAAMQLGADILVSRVAVQPGKPTWFARLGPKIMLGLPGNPASAFVCALLFLKPILARLQGEVLDMAFTPARLAAPAPGNGPRERYLRARLKVDAEARLLAEPLPEQDSGAQAGFARTDALIRRPPNAPELPAGAIVETLRFP